MPVCYGICAAVGGAREGGRAMDRLAVCRHGTTWLQWAFAYCRVHVHSCPCVTRMFCFGLGPLPYEIETEGRQQIKGGGPGYAVESC